MFYNIKYFPTMIVYDFPEIVAFEQIGAKFLIVPKGAPLLEKKQFKGVKLLKVFNNCLLYELEEGRGRFFFAEKASLRDKNEQNVSNQIMKLGEGKDGFVVVDCDPIEDSASLKSLDERGEIKVIKDSEEEINLNVKVEKKSLLVIRDILNDNWELKVDGVNKRMVRVNGCFRGVFLDNGEHNILLTHKPKLEIFLLITTFLTLLIFLGLICVRDLVAK